MKKILLAMIIPFCVNAKNIDTNKKQQTQRLEIVVSDKGGTPSPSGTLLRQIVRIAVGISTYYMLNSENAGSLAKFLEENPGFEATKGFQNYLAELAKKTEDFLSSQEQSLLNEQAIRLGSGLGAYLITDISFGDIINLPKHLSKSAQVTLSLPLYYAAYLYYKSLLGLKEEIDETSQVTEQDLLDAGDLPASIES